MRRSLDQSPYPLRIGVTGHRKLPDPAAVGQAVGRLVATIDRTLSGATGASLEWIAVSPLAAGADRIVARAVLAQANSRLEVITPFSLNDYRQDFKRPEDRAEFEELLRLDPSPTVLENPYARMLPDDSAGEIARKKALRHEGYFDAGRRVVDRCEILVAVWNGLRPTGPGSTGAVVRYAVGRGRMVLWIDSQRPSTPVRRIVATGDADDDDSNTVECAAVPTSPLELVPGLQIVDAEDRPPA